MRTHKHLLIFGLALGAVGLTSCSIPKPECTVAASTTNSVGFTGAMAYATRFVLQSGTGACAELKGDVIGMQAYHPSAADDPNLRDFSKTSIALRSQALGELQWITEDLGVVGDVAPQANALGDFTDAVPDDNDFCQVPTVSEARVIFPGASEDLDFEVPCMTDQDCVDNMVDGGVCTLIDPMDPASGSCFVTVDYPPIDLTYRWSNLQFYVTAAATGSQFTGDLEVVLDGCTATYKAVGMWPTVDCTTYDADGNPIVDADGNLVGDERYCSPEPDPTSADLPRPVGSGINPDFGPVVCGENFGSPDVLRQYYGIYGRPAYPVWLAQLDAKRCVLKNDTIPALDGFPESTAGE